MKNLSINCNIFYSFNSKKRARKPISNVSMEKRKTAKPNRFGEQETTVGHNSFFIGTETQSLVEILSTSSTSNNMNSVGENSSSIGSKSPEKSLSQTPTTNSTSNDITDIAGLIALTQNVVKKMDDMENHIIAMRVEIRNLRAEGAVDSVVNVALGVVDIQQLNDIGLPVGTKNELDMLEQKLMSKDFRDNLVSSMHSYNILFLESVCVCV